MNNEKPYMQLMKTLLFTGLFLSGTAHAGLIVSPAQDNTLFFPNVLDFNFSAVPAAIGDVTVSVYAWGDISDGFREGVAVSIGSTGGPFSSLGSWFTDGSDPVVTSRNCNLGGSGLDCYEGVQDILVSSVAFNAFGSDVTVRLAPLSGTAEVAESSAQVSLSYQAQVPEPASFGLICFGLAAIGYTRLRGNKAV